MMIYGTPTGPVAYSNDPGEARAISYSDRIITSAPRRSYRHSDVKMQRPAVEAWREAERLLGRRLGSGPWRLRRARAIPTTGTWRSYDLQLDLWLGDSNRYAAPWVSGHVQGIAADVRTDFRYFALAVECLESVGWQRVRPDDEPWHVTWGVKT